MKYLIIRFLLVFSLIGLPEYGWAVGPLETLLTKESLKHAAIGISVKEVGTGAIVVEYQQQMALTPASVTKLIPTWLALQEKGQDFRFHTGIYGTGKIADGVLAGDLVIVPGGDPTWDSRYFQNHSLISSLLEAIGKAGVTKIGGKISVEDAIYGSEIPGSWLWEDVSNYYAALYFPFNYRDNTYVLTFSTGAEGTPARLMSIAPALPGVKLINQVQASAKDRDSAWIFGGPYSRELHVKGNVPAHRSSFRIKGAMHRPDLCFIGDFTEALKNQGIAVEYKTYPESEKRLLFTFSSPSLEEIVYHTNKSSVNLFAEALGKLVTGEAWPGKAFERLENSGLLTAGMTLKDACGLSLLDAVPAELFTDLLLLAVRQQDSVFISSLPVAGIDNGLNGYYRAYPQLKGRLRAKTGSMSGVCCLSGYLEIPGGKTLAFTILINHYTCSPAGLQQAVGEFLSDLQELSFP